MFFLFSHFNLSNAIENDENGKLLVQAYNKPTNPFYNYLQNYFLRLPNSFSEKEKNT